MAVTFDPWAGYRFVQEVWESIDLAARATTPDEWSRVQKLIHNQDRMTALLGGERAFVRAAVDIGTGYGEPAAVYRGLVNAFEKMRDVFGRIASPGIPRHERRVREGVPGMTDEELAGPGNASTNWAGRQIAFADYNRPLLQQIEDAYCPAANAYARMAMVIEVEPAKAEPVGADLIEQAIAAALNAAG
ncbi:MAG TPA: hypothetical protein VM597_05580, partial [Gemmataceae bacterium]|nr:hypothetical protein [Gemmataceae bacterium]